MATIIGKYCSIAKMDEIIKPKDIPGYVTPKGQAITQDGQKFTFVYDPIIYGITYNLNSGELSDGDQALLKTTYTVEDARYVPPTPTRLGHKFYGWTPSSIETGDIGDIEFVANWNQYPSTVNGDAISAKIDEICDRTSIMSFEMSTSAPVDVQHVNISSMDTPIYMWCTDNCLWFYCKEKISANQNMSNAFEGMTMLRDIDILKDWNTETNMNISNMFYGCTLLPNVSAISDWSSGQFSSFDGAFTGTAAVNASRVPDWYRWNITVNEISSTGLTISTETRACIPGETIYPKLINGYSIVNHSYKVEDPYTECTFTYKPLEYRITYQYGLTGTLMNPKTTYTIEDETYTPGNPIRDGYTFTGWSPSCIEKGSYGNVTFIASYSGDESGSETQEGA